MEAEKRPRIPRGEYPARWEMVQRLMEAQKLDALLAYSDDRATYGAAYARYFADLPTHFEDALVFFRRGEEPCLLVGPETLGYAEEVSAVRDVRVLSEFSAEAEDYPFSRAQPLAEVVGEAPYRRVGLAARQHMGAPLFESVRSAMPQAELVDADQWLEPMRGVKSAAEIEVIRYAYAIVNRGMEAAVAAVAPGATERDIAAEAEYAMRRAGCEGYGIDPIVASGPNSRHILGRTTARRIGADDVVLLTFAPRYEGYHGACGRTVIVGDPGAETVASIEAEVHAQNACGTNLAAGRIGSEVEQLGRSVMEAAGYGKNFLYSGLHSVGVIEFEPPILGPSSHTVLADNMVISVDIPLYEAAITGSRTEDGYWLTGGGAVRLTSVPQMIRK